MELTNQLVEKLTAECKPSLRKYRQQNKGFASLDKSELESVLHEAIMMAAKSYNKERGDINKFVIAKGKWLMQLRASEYNDTPYNLTRSMFQERLVLARKTKEHERKHGETPKAVDLVETKRQAITARKLLATMNGGTVQFQDDINEDTNSFVGTVATEADAEQLAETNSLLAKAKAILSSMKPRTAACFYAYAGVDSKQAMHKVANRYRISYVRVWQIASKAAEEVRDRLITEN